MPLSRARACRVLDHVIAAAADIGLAACVTSLFSNGTAVAAEQRHAGTAIDPNAPPRQSTPSDGEIGDDELVQPDYPGGEFMKLYFDFSSPAQCRDWNVSTQTFSDFGAPKGKAGVCLLACFVCKQTLMF